MACQIFDQPPKDFKPSIEVASCYCNWKNCLLLLQRHPLKSQGNTWGVPAGKLEKGETPASALARELMEEIGIKVEESYLQPIQTVYIRQPPMDFIFHMFYLSLAAEPAILLGLQEHQSYQWVPVEIALKMNLMSGESETMKIYRSFMHNQNKEN